MGDLVIDDRHDRGGISNRRAQQGGTGWVQYLGTWDSWQNGTSCCRVSADHLRLLTVQMQAQFQPHTLNISRSCHMSSSTPSTKLVIQVPYIELWPQLGAEVVYGQIEKEGTQRMSLLYSLCRLKYIVMPKQWGWGIGRVDKRIQNWSQLTHSQQHLIPVQSWKCSWNLTSRSSGSHQGHWHTSKQREVLILHPPPLMPSRSCCSSRREVSSSLTLLAAIFATRWRRVQLTAMGRIPQVFLWRTVRLAPKKTVCHHFTSFA